MSFFSRLAFDLCHFVENNQIKEAEWLLLGHGCKNPSSQIIGIRKILDETERTAHFRRRTGSKGTYRKPTRRTKSRQSQHYL